MKNYLHVFIFLITLLIPGVSAAGRNVLAIQSMRVKPYEKAIKGFEARCSPKLKRLVISELKRTTINKQINIIKPDLIYAIGAEALSRVKHCTDIPTVYVMVLNPGLILSGEKNITGVSMNIPQKEQLQIVSKILPDHKNIGIVYDPDKTGYLVEKAEAASGSLGLNIVSNPINNPKNVTDSIIDMKGKIDLFWMLPDITIITPETVKFLFLFSLENKIPVIAFSKNYLDIGALISIGIDAFDMGSQAGEIALKIFSGKKVKDIKQVDARKKVIFINKKIAVKTGVTINDNMIYKLLKKLNKNISIVIK